MDPLSISSKKKGNILDIDNLNSLEIRAQCGDAHDSVYMASFTNDKNHRHGERGDCHSQGHDDVGEELGSYNRTT